MKTLRIVTGRDCAYVERQLFRRWWVRVSPYYRTNIEAYNYARSRGNVNLITKK